jgi:hypothetical protein
VGVRGARAGWGADWCIPCALYSSTRVRQMAKWLKSRSIPFCLSTWRRQSGQPKVADDSIAAGRKLSHKFVSEPVQPTTRSSISLASSLPSCRIWRPSDRGRTLETSFCLGVFTEQARAPKSPPPTYCPARVGPETEILAACAGRMTMCGTKQICFRIAPARQRRRNRRRRRAHVAPMTV